MHALKVTTLAVNTQLEQDSTALCKHCLCQHAISGQDKVGMADSIDMAARVLQG